MVFRWLSNEDCKATNDRVLFARLIVFHFFVNKLGLDARSMSCQTLQKVIQKLFMSYFANLLLDVQNN